MALRTASSTTIKAGVLLLALAVLAGCADKQYAIKDEEKSKTAWRIYVDAEASDPEKWRSLCRAADYGYRRARIHVSRRYASGEHPFGEDRVKAHMWLLITLRSGHPKMVKYVRASAWHLTDQQLAAADKLAANWQPGDCEADISAAIGRSVSGDS